MIQESLPIISNCRGLILVVDGDNTLWDTNCVFESAQRWLIKSIGRAKSGVSATLSFEQLRRVDNLLIRLLGHQEYDFQLLALALLYLQEGMKETKVVSTAMAELRRRPNSTDAKIAAEINKGFQLKLKKVPPLLPYVSRSLRELEQLKMRYRGRLTLILMSEGNNARLQPILGSYLSELQVFDIVSIIERKSIDTLLHAKVEGSKMIEHQSGCSLMQIHMLVVGDSIKSDIEPGNSIGAITIYIPGKYKGTEEPTVDSERPAIVLKSFHDVPKLVGSILLSLAT